MSNAFHFTGRLGKTPKLQQYGDTTVAKFVLIRNEYAGKDDQGKRKENTVSIQFTAFDGIAKAIVENNDTGDQLMITARIENNDYKPEGSNDTVYGFNFVVEDFDFGARAKDKPAPAAKPGKRR